MRNVIIGLSILVLGIIITAIFFNVFYIFISRAQYNTCVKLVKEGSVGKYTPILVEGTQSPPVKQYGMYISEKEEKL